MRCAMKTSGASETSHAAPSRSEQREREPAPEVAALDRLDELPRLPELGRELLHANAAQVAAVGLHAASARPRRRAAAGSRRDRRRSPTGRSARPRRCPRTRGPRRASRRVRHRVRRRRDAAGQRVLLQRVALALIELPHGGFERARQAIEFAGGRVAEAAIEQRGGDPDRRRQRQDAWRRETRAIRRLRSRFIGDRAALADHGRSRNGPASIACVQSWPSRAGSARRSAPQREARVVVRRRRAVAVQDAVLEPNPERRVAPSEPSALTGTVSCSRHQASAAAASGTTTDRDGGPTCVTANRSSQRS